MNGMTFAAETLALPRVARVTVTDDTLSVDLEDGRTIAVPIVWFPRLAHGAATERANFQISSAGYGIHWPDLDEDIGVKGLLLGLKSARVQPRSNDGSSSASKNDPEQQRHNCSDYMKVLGPTRRQSFMGSVSLFFGATGSPELCAGQNFFKNKMPFILFHSLPSRIMRTPPS